MVMTLNLSQEEMLNTIRELKAFVSDLSQCLQSCRRCHTDYEEYSDHDDQYHRTQSLETYPPIIAHCIIDNFMVVDKIYGWNFYRQTRSPL